MLPSLPPLPIKRGLNIWAAWGQDSIMASSFFHPSTQKRSFSLADTYLDASFFTVYSRIHWCKRASDFFVGKIDPIVVPLHHAAQKRSPPPLLGVPSSSDFPTDRMPFLLPLSFFPFLSKYLPCKWAKREEEATGCAHTAGEKKKRRRPPISRTFHASRKKKKKESKLFF